MKGQSFYPAYLMPDPDSYETIPGTSIKVPAKNMKFKEWAGKRLADDFGGKPVIDFDGRPLFAELVIQRLAMRSGWTAYWQEVYPPRKLGPYYYTDWKDDLKRVQQSSITLDQLSSPYHQDLLLKIKKKNNDNYRGFWDVVAWKGQQTLFVESKWKDEIGNNQIDWLSAALSAELGLALEKNFLILRWEFC